MLIKNYKVYLFEPPCLPGSKVWSARIEIDSDISDLLPYINGYLKKRYFDPEKKVLIFAKDNHRIALRPNEIRISNILDKDEGERLAKSILNFINEIFEKRDEIKPDYTKKEPPKALEIYKLLPKTNCKKCGEVSCLAFATKLSQGDVDIEFCLPLKEERYKDMKKELERILGVNDGD